MIANTAAEVLRSIAYLVVAVGFLGLVVVAFMLRTRLTHMGADIKGVKLEVNAENPDSLKAKVQQLTTTVTEEVKPALDEFGKSVNNVPIGSPTLVQRVGLVELHQREMKAEFGSFRDEVRNGQKVILSRLDGLERAARQTAQFQAELVAKIGLEIARGGEKETPA